MVRQEMFFVVVVVFSRYNIDFNKQLLDHFDTDICHLHSYLNFCD